jgi:hypothetical protein
VRRQLANQLRHAFEVRRKARVNFCEGLRNQLLARGIERRLNALRQFRGQRVGMTAQLRHLRLQRRIESLVQFVKCVVARGIDLPGEFPHPLRGPFDIHERSPRALQFRIQRASDPGKSLMRV